jgi:hypothetical protein
VERLTRPIVVSRIPKVELRYALICVVTGGRFSARKTKKECEADAAWLAPESCWICAERARKDSCIVEATTVTSKYQTWVLRDTRTGLYYGGHRPGGRPVANMPRDRAEEFDRRDIEEEFPDGLPEGWVEEIA